VTTKEITKVGSRSSKPEKAAGSALQAAAGEVAPFASERLVRKVGQNVLVRRLVISGLGYYASVTRIMAHLKAQPGVNDVRLACWSEGSATARLTVYLQPAAKDNLGIYVTKTTGLDILIEHVDNNAATGGLRPERSGCRRRTSAALRSRSPSSTRPVRA
jgi:hypothetical protein